MCIRDRSDAVHSLMVGGMKGDGDECAVMAGENAVGQKVRLEGEVGGGTFQRRFPVLLRDVSSGLRGRCFRFLFYLSLIHI